MNRRLKNSLFILLLLILTISCRRRTYVCECKGSNNSFQNVFFNATEREARDLCNAAEEKFEAGNPNLECEIFLQED
jgi:hypothetical protein